MVRSVFLLLVDTKYARLHGVITNNTVVLKFIKAFKEARPLARSPNQTIPLHSLSLNSVRHTLIISSLPREGLEGRSSYFNIRVCCIYLDKHYVTVKWPSTDGVCSDAETPQDCSMLATAAAVPANGEVPSALGRVSSTPRSFRCHDQFIGITATKPEVYLNYIYKSTLYITENIPNLHSKTSLLKLLKEMFAASL